MFTNAYDAYDSGYMFYTLSCLCCLISKYQQIFVPVLKMENMQVWFYFSITVPVFKSYV